MSKTQLCKRCGKKIHLPKKSNKLYCDDCAEKNTRENNLCSKRKSRSIKKEKRKTEDAKKIVQASFDKIKTASSQIKSLEKTQKFFSTFTHTPKIENILTPFGEDANTKNILIKTEREKLKKILGKNDIKETIKED